MIGSSRISDTATTASSASSSSSYPTNSQRPQIPVYRPPPPVPLSQPPLDDDLSDSNNNDDDDNNVDKKENTNNYISKSKTPSPPPPIAPARTNRNVSATIQRQEITNKPTSQINPLTPGRPSRKKQASPNSSPPLVTASTPTPPSRIVSHQQKLNQVSVENQLTQATNNILNIATKMTSIDYNITDYNSGDISTKNSTKNLTGKNEQLPNTKFYSNYRPTLPWILLNGEVIVDKNENDSTLYTQIVFVMPDNRAIRGKLYITNFRLYFLSDDFRSTSTQTRFIIDNPLGLIQKVEKIGNTASSKSSNPYGLLITCKNGRRLRFANSQENKGLRKQIFEVLHRYAFPLSNSLRFFAYDYRFSVSTDEKPGGLRNGWNIYNVNKEYERMGAFKEWRIFENKDLCQTYPRYLVVPKAVTDKELYEVH